MTDELEIKGLDEDLGDDDLDFPTIIWFEMLYNAFVDLNMLMPKYIINIIHDYCQAGFAYFHTRDGGEFAVEKSALALSKLLNIQSDLNPFEPVHVSKVSREAFSHIADYLTHHNGVKPAKIAKPIRSVKMSQIVEQEWDAKFADSMSKRLVFQVMLGANYIDCSCLLELMCAKIATLIKGKSPEEIKRILSTDDEVLENTKTEQQEYENQSICMCGYVWQEQKKEEVKIDETDQEVGEIKEEICNPDEDVGQESPQALDDGSLQETDSVLVE